MVDHHPIDTSLPVVVIGAGPVGLAAAAHLAERGLPFLVLEAAAKPAASVRQWGHLGMFSPWRYNIDDAAGRLLDAAGWSSPDLDTLPTGAELVEAYLEPLARLPAIAPYVRYGAQVVAVARLSIDRVCTAGREDTPFVVRLDSGEEIQASAVIDASGTWTRPSPLGVNGLPAHGESEASAWIDPALPDVLGADRERYANRHTAVVGAGHSAVTTLLALSELAKEVPGTRITWVIRAATPAKAYGGEDPDLLPERAALGARIRPLVETGQIALVSSFGVGAVRPLTGTSADGGVELVAADGSGRVVVADQVVAATGYRPNHSIAAELRLDLDPILGSPRELGPLIDPNEHDCCSVHPHGLKQLSHAEPNYWAVGIKSYGRATGFLMVLGYEQVRQIAAALAGDWTAAYQIQLDLPEVGVCSTALAAVTST